VHEADLELPDLNNPSVGQTLLDGRRVHVALDPEKMSPFQELHNLFAYKITCVQDHVRIGQVPVKDAFKCFIHLIEMGI
jgi:hypothetical protein